MQGELRFTLFTASVRQDLHEPTLTGEPMSSPLYKILYKFNQFESDVSLTCDECFTILNYLADEASAGVDPRILYQAARQHLAGCRGCREHH